MFGFLALPAALAFIQQSWAAAIPTDVDLSAKTFAPRACSNYIDDGEFDKGMWTFVSNASLSGTSNSNCRNGNCAKLWSMNQGMGANSRIVSPSTQMWSKIGPSPPQGTYALSYWLTLPWYGGAPSCNLTVSIGNTTIDRWISPDQHQPSDAVPYTQRTGLLTGSPANQKILFDWTCPFDPSPNAYASAPLAIDSVVLQPAKDVLVNGNMEGTGATGYDLASWTTSGRQYVESADGQYQPYEGKRSASFVLAQNAPWPVSMNQTVQGAVTIGSNYKLRFSYLPLWVWGNGQTDESNTCYLEVKVDDYHITKLSFPRMNNNPGLPYVTFMDQTGFVAQTSNPKVTFGLTCGSAVFTGRINVDAVSLTTTGNC